MKRLTALVVFLVPLAANAFDPARCNNDNDTAPSFSAGRDSNGCLLIESGNGLGQIKFDYEENDKTHYGAFDEEMPGHANGPANCTSTNDCALVLWNVNFDEYLEPTSNLDSGDALEWGTKGYKYLLFRNVGWGNTFKCQGGAWTSPQGYLHCPAGQSSGGHVDALQLDNQPTSGGWAVFQMGSKLVNANDLHMIQQMNVSSDSPGAHVVWQGGFFGFEPGWGAAEDWNADCIQYGDTPCATDYSSSGRAQLASTKSIYPGTVWFINSRSRVKLALFRNSKVIIVNGGINGPCSNDTGCGPGNSIGYQSGWPAPLGHFYTDSDFPPAPGNGPGTCPNGEIEDDLYTGEALDVHVYCYTSIDAAIAAGQTRPPFIQPELDPTGWADADGDLIPDFQDNCTDKANAGTASCDIDHDGYGNSCDGDFDQNWAVGGSDSGIYTAHQNTYQTPPAITDMNCDGYTGGGTDYGLFTAQFNRQYPGPSGLTCAGMAPCAP